METKSKRGGARPGAGRKPTGRKQALFYVSDAEKEQLKTYLQQLRTESISDVEYALWQKYGDGKVYIDLEPPEEIPIGSMDRKRCVLELVRVRLSVDCAKRILNDLSIPLRCLQNALACLADMPMGKIAKNKSELESWVLDYLASAEPTTDDPAAALRRAWHEAYMTYRMSYTTTAWRRLWVDGQERLVICRYVLPDGSWRYAVGDPLAAVADIADNYEIPKGSRGQKWAIVDRRLQLLYPVGSQMVSLT